MRYAIIGRNWDKEVVMRAIGDAEAAAQIIQLRHVMGRAIG